MSYPDERESNAFVSASARAPRQSRLLKAALYSDRFDRFEFTVRNISQTGIGGGGTHTLLTGEQVIVELPGQPQVQGTVRWVSATRFGIEVHQPIQLDNLRSVFADGRLPATGPNDFQIIPPPQIRMRRPGLKLGAASPASPDRSSWVSD